MKIKIPIPSFGYEFQVFISDNENQSLKYNKKLCRLCGCFNDNKEGIIARTYEGYSKKTNDRVVGIVPILFNKKHLTNGIIAHEALHAVSFMLNRIGVPFTESTEEVYAYILGYVIHAINKALND